MNYIIKMNLPQPTELFMQSENKINVCELPARASEQTSQIAFMVRSDRSRVLQTSSSLPQERRAYGKAGPQRALFIWFTNVLNFNCDVNGFLQPVLQGK